MVRKTLLMAAALSLLVALPALAQGNPTGKLTGRVTADDAPLPGVRVTVESPNLQGSRDTFTGASGDYLFAALPPGTYTAAFEMEGLETRTLQVVVAAAQTAILNVSMSVEVLAEEIVVTGARETVSESTSNDTTFPAETVEKLAIGRNLEAAVLLAPGVDSTGPGNNISISGSQSFENLFLINGVVVNENLRGQPLDLFIEDAIQETTTSTSGISAEYGRFTGGVVNAITKSGGNQLSGSLRVSLVNEDWEGETPVTVAQEDKIQETYEGTLGGYFWKDRLWFFTAARTFDTSTAEQTFVTDFPYSRGSTQDRIEGKLTAALTKSHTLLGSYIDIDQSTTNNDPFGIVLELAALTDREDPQTLTAFNYTGIVSSNLFVEAQYSEREFTIGKGGGSNATDFIGGTTLIDLQNSAGTYHTPYFCGFCRDEDRNNESILAKGSYFLSTESSGSHDIVFGYDSFSDLTANENHQSPTGFQIWGDTTILRDGELFPVFTPGVAWVQWFPIFNETEGADFTTDSIFVNDRWQFNDKWSFNIGFRYDQNDGTNSSGGAVADDSRISPRFAFSYDVRGDGDWVVRGTAGQYVAALNFGVADSTSTAGVPADFEWDYQGPPINPDPDAAVLIDQDTAIQIVFDWFDSVGGINNTDLLFFASVPGANTIIPENGLKSPIANEITLGFSKRLGSRGQVRVDYVYRDFGDFYFERRDLTTGQTSTPELGDFDLGIIENNDSQVERRYDGVNTQFSYRIGSRFNLGGNWTWSHARGNFDGETRDSGPLTSSVGEYPEYKAFPQNNPRGDLGVDRRNKARVWAIWDVLQGDRHRLSLSWLENFFSGTSYGAVGAVSSRDFIANPGYLTPPREVSYFYTARDAFTSDDVHRSDLALNYSFVVGGNRDFEFFIQPEVINLFDEDAVIAPNTTILDATNAGGFAEFDPFTETPVQGVHWDFGSRFGQGVREDDFQVPRTFRFSVGFRF